MLKLYTSLFSGNGYKVRLFLNLLNLEHELVILDLHAQEHKTPAILTLNPFGQVPILIDDDLQLRDSQAILVYLAKRYGSDTWLPNDARSIALLMQWLSTAANDIANSFSAARVYHLFDRPLDIAGSNLVCVG